MKLNKKGFSLLELLIVVIIISGFAAFAYPSYVSSIEHARASEAVQMLGAIQAAQQKHFVSYDEYATQFSDINDFIPAIKDFDPDVNSFNSDYFTYTLGASSSTATRLAAGKGYSLAAEYTKDYITCIFSGDNGERICSSLTDRDPIGSTYRIY